MNPGSIFFDRDFHFNDGETGQKLFVVLGNDKGVTIVAKTTSKIYGKGINYGCQPNDRFHNFYLPLNCSYLKESTWVCLDEFYELKQAELLTKRFSGVVCHICDLEPKIAKEIQECALLSDDISKRQADIVKQSLL